MGKKKKEENLTVYMCRTCDATYRLKENALTCCSRICEVTMYACDECNESYESEDEARDCCEDSKIEILEVK